MSPPPAPERADFSGGRDHPKDQHESRYIRVILLVQTSLTHRKHFGTSRPESIYLWHKSRMKPPDGRESTMKSTVLGRISKTRHVIRRHVTRRHMIRIHVTKRHETRRKAAKRPATRHHVVRHIVRCTAERRSKNHCSHDNNSSLTPRSDRY